MTPQRDCLSIILAYCLINRGARGLCFLLLVLGCSTSAPAQQLEKEYIRLGSRVIAIENPESISTPTVSGPLSGGQGISYVYTASGAIDSSGNAVEYEFSWGDGSNSGWLAAGTTTASKSWAATGTYKVTVQARSATNTAIVSAVSSSISVVINAEAVSQPTTPSGTSSGNGNTNYSYSTGGSVDSLGYSVQYEFSWGDGTSSPWLAVGTTSTTHAWSSAGTFSVTAQARSATNPSVVSVLSNALAVTIGAGSISTPSAPAGTTSGLAATSYTYTASGSVCSWGDSVQYEFFWGDSTNSGWLAAGTTSSAHTWSAPGSYTVTAQARCSIHTAVISAASPGLAVTMTDPVPYIVEFIPSGTGVTQTFTVQVEDYKGASSITYVQPFLSISSTLSNTSNSCHLEYVASAVTLYLDSSAGTDSWVGHQPEGGSWTGTNANGICEVNSWSVSNSGNYVTLTFSLTFQTTGTWYEFVNASNATGNTAWVTNGLTWTE